MSAKTGSAVASVVRLHAYGGPEVLCLEQLELPEPGPGEVRIRVGAIGLNRFEILYREGQYLPGVLPSMIGAEAAGVVDRVGPGVTGVAPGDRVATLTGPPMDRYGTYGEAILFPAEMVVKLAAMQSLVEAAASWMAYVTAYALVSVAAIGEGDVVAITAASSSVGLAAIQIARAHGATPIAVTRGRSKSDALLAKGAAHVVVSEEEDVAARLRELTGGRGVRIAFDAVGGPQLSALATATASGGTLIFYGVLSGVAPDSPWVLAMANNLTLRGFAAYSLTQDPRSRAEVVDYVSRGLANGALRPVIDSQFDLADISQAHRRLESNCQLGKIVVTTAAVADRAQT